MRTIFTGTSPFAVPCLEAVLASEHEVAAVVTQQDRPRGRGRELHMPPVKEIALQHSIPVLQPERIADANSVSELKKHDPIDAMIVVAYGQKIPPAILEWPKHGVVNVHGSILPKYRGAAPIQYAIINGDTQTGITTMLMDEGWDTGDILLQETVDIGEDENSGELAVRLAAVGANLLVRTLDGLEAGSISPVKQDDSQATLARSLDRDAGAIDWSKTAGDIVNLIRGCTPRPGAFTNVDDTQVKVWRAVVVQPTGRPGEPGEVIDVSRDGVLVAAGEGSVKLIEVQPESRKRMSAGDFARGSDVAVGSRFRTRAQGD